MTDGWHWAAAVVVAVLLIVLVLLRYDTLRDRPGTTVKQATRRALPWFAVVPVGFLLALFLPLWVGAVLIAGPLIVITVMALAN